MATIKSITRITNDDLSIKYTFEESYTQNDKLEYGLNLSAAESKAVDITLLDSPKEVIFSSTSAFDVVIVHNANTITFPTTYFKINPEAFFLTNLTSITLTNSGATEILVNVNVYGV